MASPDRPVLYDDSGREVPRGTPTGVDLERAIAHQVRSLRLASGLSVGDMAAKVGISKAMLSKIENAQTSCSLSTLARLAAGLDVPVTSLFRGADTRREAVFTKNGQGAEIVGRYKENNPAAGKTAGWFRIDNTLRVESTVQLPILISGTSTIACRPKPTTCSIACI